MTEQLKKLLLHQLGETQGTKIWEQAEVNYKKFIVLAIGEPEDRKKNLVNGIYPYAAIYSALLAEKMSKEAAMDQMFALMKKVTMNGNRKFYSALGKFPFFFALFRKMFSTGLKGSSWKVDWVANDSEKFIYNIRSCLWHDACRDLGYPELCKIFCRNDEINFTDVSKHLYFERTTTLGDGGDCCDFHFYSKKPE